MIEQLSNSVKFLSFYTANKVGKTGLTPTVDVYDPAGTKVVTDGAAVEIGGGLYSYTLDASLTAVVGEYLAIFKTSDATVDQQHIPALWSVGRGGIENLDASIASIKARTDTLGASTIVVTSPVTTTGVVETISGDDYDSADGRAILWTGGSAWIDLTGCTVSVHILGLTFPATVVTPSGATKVIQLELTHEQSSSIPLGCYDYRIVATQADGDVATLVKGRWNSI